MSSTPPSYPNSGYASPAHPGTTPISAITTKTSSKPKPANVFSNDGSFLERIQRSKKESEDKKKSEGALAKKLDFDNRFKKRGKRPLPDSVASAITSENPAAKKVKSDQPLTEYEKQVKSFAVRTLKNDGMGVRPLVK